MMDLIIGFLSNTFSSITADLLKKLTKQKLNQDKANTSKDILISDPTLGKTLRRMLFHDIAMDKFGKLLTERTISVVLRAMEEHEIQYHVFKNGEKYWKVSEGNIQIKWTFCDAILYRVFCILMIICLLLPIVFLLLATISGEFMLTIFYILFACITFTLSIIIAEMSRENIAGNILYKKLSRIKIS